MPAERRTHSAPPIVPGDVWTFQTGPGTITLDSPETSSGLVVVTLDEAMVATVAAGTPSPFTGPAAPYTSLGDPVPWAVLSGAELRQWFTPLADVCDALAATERPETGDFDCVHGHGSADEFSTGMLRYLLDRTADDDGAPYPDACVGCRSAARAALAARGEPA